MDSIIEMIQNLDIQAIIEKIVAVLKELLAKFIGNSEDAE